MANPYEWIVANPELVFWYAFVACVSAAWIFVSYRKMFKWLDDIAAAKGRWEFFLLPPDDLTWSIVGVFVVSGANLALFGLFLYVVL